MEKASRGRVRAVKESVAAELFKTKRVLEIGCGTGELAAMLIAQGAQVDGFDMSPAMVKVARQRILIESLQKKFTVRRMGVDEMDGLPASYYDAVVSTLVLSELSDDERHFTLNHSARVLKPNGLIVIADEVVPQRILPRFAQTIIRAPMLIASYLVSRSITRPISNLSGELTGAGFTVEKEKRSQGDSFALVVGRLESEGRI
jgi:demethylmenaquinone methyltransferase/2-methoxy-6-polyprenyl-1,4-benzoquinol methylase